MKLFIVGMFALGSSFPVWSSEPYHDYRKRIESSQNLTSLSDALFGESVSLYNGKTEFLVTDIDLPGNGSLPVRLQRRFNVELSLTGTASSFNASLNGAGGVGCGCSLYYRDVPRGWVAE